MKNRLSVLFVLDWDVFDKVSNNNLLIKLEPCRTCSAGIVTDVCCDENALNFISWC